jgi:hypothetical protein
MGVKMGILGFSVRATSVYGFTPPARPQTSIHQHLHFLSVFCTAVRFDFVPLAINRTVFSRRRNGRLNVLVPVGPLMPRRGHGRSKSPAD